MAKFHNYHVLCPLIDQKSFLGISHDNEKEHVIVTLGRNVVNKYRLLDQKQVAGWTSKDHITSAVVYDKELDCYAAVFNNNTIKTWKAEVSSLEKLKKYKFPAQILRILQRRDESIVIFSNGSCALLSHLVENVKTYKTPKSVIKENQMIMKSAFYRLNNLTYICHILKNQNNDYEILTGELKEGSGELNKSKLSLEEVSRPDEISVIGKLIVPKKLGVCFMWSDGKLTYYDLATKNWKTIGTVPWISTASSISMTSISLQHVAIFGNSADQDGAVLIAYNIELGIASRKYPMKLYSEGAKLYSIGNRIILEASNHIAILSFTLETTRNLASILGSHELRQNDCTVISDWDTPVEPLYKINEKTKDLLSVGLSERHICSQVIIPLLEKEDYVLVFNTLSDFDDVPESVLALTLKYIIKLINPLSADLTNLGNLHAFFFGPFDGEENLNKNKLSFLNSLLKISYSDSLLFPYLRNHLSFEDAMFLLSYIMCLLVGSDDSFDNDYEKKLIDWFTTIMDAFYQQMVITKDEKVASVLKNAKHIVVKLINHLMSINEMLPAVNKVLSGKPSIENDDEFSSYSIELIHL